MLAFEINSFIQERLLNNVEIASYAELKNMNLKINRCARKFCFKKTSPLTQVTFDQVYYVVIMKKLTDESQIAFFKKSDETILVRLLNISRKQI